MKYAIYFVAVGDAALSCLELSYNSLCRAGFEGDIYILSDVEKVSFKISENTKILKIRDEHLNLDEETDKQLAFFDVRRLDKKNPRNVRNPYTTRKFAICHMKSLADDYIPMSKYNYIIYLDVDVLTNGSIDVLNKFLQQNNGKIVTSKAEDESYLGGRGNFSLKKFKRAPTTVAANLTTWELLKYWFTHPICADIICFPVNARGKSFLAEWKKECQKGIDSDQAALQAILLRGFRDVHTLAPYSLFGYGPQARNYEAGKQMQKVGSVFVHFGGAVKDISAMEAYYIKHLR